MQDSVSPEEKLLRLIRGERKKSLPKDEKKTQGFKASQAEEKTQPSTLFRISNLSKIVEHPSLSQINHILLIIFLTLGIYLLADFIILNPGRIKNSISAIKEVKGPVLEIPIEISSSVKPVSYYTQPIKSKTLFTAQSPEINQVRPSPTFLEMVSKFKLQGIISGPNPQAIIEDITAKQVYFLSPGDYIGEIELKEILPGKVILNYYGQEANLAL